MAGPEGLVQKKILRILAERGAYTLKIHGSAHQAKTIDIVACYRGRFIGIEVKRPAKVVKATPRQEYTLEEIREAGGIAFVTAEPEHVSARLDAIDALEDASSI